MGIPGIGSGALSPGPKLVPRGQCPFTLVTLRQTKGKSAMKLDASPSGQGRDFWHNFT